MQAILPHHRREPVPAASACVDNCVGEFIAPALSFLFESLWKKAYGELVPQQFALSQCDDYKAECKKWLRLHLSSEWCATSASLLSLSLCSSVRSTTAHSPLSAHRQYRYREARKEGRWRFDCPRNDEDWVYDRFFRVALVGDVGTGKVPCVDTLSSDILIFRISRAFRCCFGGV